MLVLIFIDSISMVKERKIGTKGHKTLMSEWRVAKNLSLNDIAKKMGITRECVRLWERGRTRASLENIIFIAGILGVKPHDIERHFAEEAMKRRGIMSYGDEGEEEKKELKVF